MRLWVLAMGLTSRPEAIKTSPLLSPAENLTAVAAQTNGWAEHRTEPMMQIDNFGMQTARCSRHRAVRYGETPMSMRPAWMNNRERSETLPMSELVPWRQRQASCESSGAPPHAPHRLGCSPSLTARWVCDPQENVFIRHSPALRLHPFVPTFLRHAPRCSHSAPREPCLPTWTEASHGQFV